MSYLVGFPTKKDIVVTGRRSLPFTTMSNLVRAYDFILVLRVVLMNNIRQCYISPRYSRHDQSVYALTCC